MLAVRIDTASDPPTPHCFTAGGTIMRTTRIPALALVIVALTTVAQTAASQSKDEREIRALSDQWQKDVAAKNVDGIVALHAPDAVVMFSHAPLIKGTDAI